MDQFFYNLFQIHEGSCFSDLQSFRKALYSEILDLQSGERQAQLFFFGTLKQSFDILQAYKLFLQVFQVFLAFS